MRKKNKLARRNEVFGIVELEDKDLTRVVAGLKSANVLAGCDTNFGCADGCTNNCPEGCSSVAVI